MARKGFAAKLARALRRASGGDGAAYRGVKRLAYSLIKLFDCLSFLSPRDLAYRISPPRTPLPAGFVTKVDARGISGIAFRDAQGQPVPVELLVDGKPINRTWATQKVLQPSLYAGSPEGFHFPMKEVWRRLLRSQALEVRAGGRELRYGPGRGRPIPNRGARRIADRGIAELAAEGYLINKFGRIQKSRSESAAWANRAFGAYSELNAVFEREFSAPLFAFYGAMLGFAREGGILAHDLDLDLAYFSEMDSPEAVRLEFKARAARLAAVGVTVVPHTYKLQFGGLGLSVTPCWISGGRFSSTFGYVGEGFSVAREDILPLRKAAHAGYQIWLPNNPQAVAAYLYGRGWRYPDPGWKWLPEYKAWPETLAARLTEQDLRELRASGIPG